MLNGCQSPSEQECPHSPSAFSSIVEPPYDRVFPLIEKLQDKTLNLKPAKYVFSSLLISSVNPVLTF